MMDEKIPGKTHVGDGESLDEGRLRDWVEQASRLPGVKM